MEQKVRIQDDLFEAVNGEWLATAVIPDDKPLTGGFALLDEGVEKLMMSEFDAWAKGEKEPALPEIKEAVKLYRKVLDEKRRNEEGIAPVLPTLEKILSIKNVADLNALLYDLLLEDAPLPFNCGVTDDMADATKHCFVLLGPSIILPDTTYYAEDNPAGPQLLQIYASMASQALAFTPLSEEEQKKFVEDTLAFDALVAKSVKSQVEWADYVNNHNPMPLDEVQKLLAPVDFKGVLKQIYKDNAPETIIVYDPRAIKEFSLYFNEANLGLFLHWCYVKTLLSATGALSLPLKEIGTIYRRALTGVAKNPTLEKQAYRVASGMFAEPIGVYYGRTYFGEEAKQDAIAMVKQIIETYKGRIRKNRFLKEATKEKAILKLSTMAIKMGYPDAIDPFYATLKVDEGDSYFQALQKLEKQCTLHSLEKLSKPVDHNEWGMPGHMVNACYNPSANDITFPAAILQKPFYSLSQSKEENLGGIGAVIGHEISHAFDNNGAHFDELGNLANWWTDEDFKAFDDLTKGMIEQWDGIPFHGGKVNGTLVVSENIADNGGMGVTLEIMHTLEHPNFQAYFKNWAKVWCRKAKEEYIQLLLASDVHSPAELRANIQPRNFPEWYEAFSVTEKDGMYIPEEKRISIW